MIEAINGRGFCPNGDTKMVEATFQNGNKVLQVSVHPTGEAFTYLNTIAEVPKIEGATTAVYGELKDFFRRYANERNTTIEYSFSTQTDSMKAWAKSPEKGQRIFSWDFS